MPVTTSPLGNPLPDHTTLQTETRTISTQTGDLAFDNVTIKSTMSVDELLRLPTVTTERWASHAGYVTYRIRPLKIGSQGYSATVSFFDACIERVSFSPITDVLCWDDVTDASIQREGELLIEFMNAEFGNAEKVHSFPWGTVTLWQDARNAFTYSITVAYQRR